MMMAAADIVFESESDSEMNDKLGSTVNMDDLSTGLPNFSLFDPIPLLPDLFRPQPVKKSTPPTTTPPFESTVKRMREAIYFIAGLSKEQQVPTDQDIIKAYRKKMRQTLEIEGYDRNKVCPKNTPTDSTPN